MSETNNETKNIVLESISEECENVSPENLDLAADLRQDLEIDSLSLMSIITVIEDEFNLEIPEADIDALRTVGDLVSYVENARSNN